MKLEWILLAIFLVSVVNNVAKAMRNPMLKNVLRLISIIVAIVFTYILHILFGAEFLFELLKEQVDIASLLPAEYAHLVTNAIDIVVPFISTALTPMLLFLAFWIFYFIFNLIHVNFVYKFLVKKQRRKDKKMYKAFIKREKEIARREIIEEHERNLALMDDSEDLEINSYPDEELDEDEIEDMVDERISHYKKYKKRKYNFFKDSFPKKVISIVTGALSAFLIFGVTWISLFYTMDVLSRVTDSIHDTGAYDSKVYCAVEFVDKHIVDPYEESFVYKLYDSTAAIDFMTSTIRDGGKFEFEGKTLYADDMVRDYFVRAVRLACELTSKESDQSHVVGDIGAIIKEPVMVSFLADVVVTLVDANDQWVDGILNPEPGSENETLNKFLAKIIEAYRDDEGNWSSDAVKNDFNAILDVVLISAENKLLANIISNSMDWDSILGDREMISDVIGTISGVTFFGPVMETAFTMGMDAVGGILAPADNAAAYEQFVNKIITNAQDPQEISEEDMQKFYDFMVDVGEYKKNGSKIAYYQGKIDRNNATIDAHNATIVEKEAALEGATPEEQITLTLEIDALKEKIADLQDKNAKIEAEDIAPLVEEQNASAEKMSILDYILDSIYVIELVQKDGKALKAQAEQFLADSEECMNKVAELQAALNNPETTNHEELLLQIAELTERANDLEKQANDMYDTVTNLISDAESTLSGFTAKTEGLLPFMNYYMAWNNTQKPFMIAGEDKSVASLAVVVDGVTYYCNTDVLNFKKLIDVLASFKDFNFDFSDIVDFDHVGENEDKLDYFLEIKVSEIIEKINPELQALIDELIVTPNKESLHNPPSELTELVDYLIKQAYNPEVTVDENWLIPALEAYVAVATSEESKSLAERIINAKDDHGSFDYKGVTSEHIIDVLNFGEEWTTEAKQADVKLLTEIIFDFVDYAKKLGEGSIMPASSFDTSQFDGILEILTTLGGTMDKMAQTTCLHGVPQIMLESILKNEYVSMVMTPSMLYGEDGYMSRIEAGNLSYEEFMQELVDTVKELLDALGNIGGSIA